MDFTNFWLNDRPPAPTPEEQRYSLRFRGSQYMERTNVDPTYGQHCCLSFWYKDASYQGQTEVDSALINSALSWPPSNNDQISLRITDTSSFTDGRLLAGQNNQIDAGGGRNDLNCTRAIRDYSAWYHIVFQINSNEADPVDRYKFWINGEPEQYNNPNDPPRQAEVNALNTGGSKTMLGSIIYGSGTQTYCNGYMSDVYFIDGALPGPTAFGEYNEDGIWVPKSPGAKWSNDLTTSSVGWLTGYPPENAFNSDLRNPEGAAAGTEDGGTITWAPKEEIHFTKTLEVYCYTGTIGGTGTVEFDGDTANFNSIGWVTVRSGPGIINESNPIVITAPSDDVPSIGGFRIDGQIFMDHEPKVGNNGYHLDFADPNDIGADVSGADNHFSATGFGLNSSPTYSDTLYEGSGNFNYNVYGKNFNNIHEAFDGTDGGSANAPEGNWIIWQNFGDWYNIGPVDSVTIRVITSSTWINEGALTDDTSSDLLRDLTFDMTSKGSPPLTSIAIKQPAGGGIRTSLAKVTVVQNGVEKVLIEGAGVDYDHMKDHPTRNYPLQNPLQMISKGGSVVDQGSKLSDGNLTSYDSTGYTNSTSTIALPNDGNGRYYAECTIKTVGLLGVGVCDINSGNDSNRYNTNNMVYGNGGTINLAGGIGTEPYGASYGDRDIIGLEYNSATRELTFYKNGVSQGVAPRPLAEGVDFCIHDDLAGHTVSWNYGQRPFVHQPDGTESLISTKLPNAPIPNGRDHFQVVTGPGQGVDNAGAGQTGGNFSQDVTVSPGGFQDGFAPHNLFDGNQGNDVRPDDQSATITWAPDGGFAFASRVEVFIGSNDNTCNVFVNGTERIAQNIRGWNTVIIGSGTINSLAVGPSGGGGIFTGVEWGAIRIDDNILVDFGILTLAQQAFPSGLWWIKDRENANQHQLVDSVRGALALQSPTAGAETAYVAPSGDSVAWCWNAGGPAVANNDGTAQSMVAANAQAGFSIISYTGTGASATFGHGLERAPELLITKHRGSDPSSDGRMYAHTTVLPGNSVDFGYLNQNSPFAPSDAPAPTDTVISWSSGFVGQNGAGENYVCYAFASVPGYSSFGSYDGNNDSKGVFVYTGFRPAFIMFKVIDSTGEWVIYDSTRNIYNPVDARLAPNNTNEERTSTGMHVDFLSNGFKHYNAEVDLNNDFTYLYCAFAENPFSGSAPVNAR